MVVTPSPEASDGKLCVSKLKLDVRCLPPNQLLLLTSLFSLHVLLFS